MKLNATFVTSAFAPDGFPKWARIEVAIAGRSNVGKSSLINSLAATKGLARTSKTPGRTRSLNFFSIGERLAIVDLPGFGYARMPHAMAAGLAVLIDDYLTLRADLGALVILVDARRGAEREEIAMAQAARDRGVEVIPIGTKCDKLRRSDYARVLASLAPLGRDPILCSALKGDGIEELRRRIMTFTGQSHRRALEAGAVAAGTGRRMEH